MMISRPASRHGQVDAWERKLSFADVTLGEVIDQKLKIEAELGYDWNADGAASRFWEAVLAESPVADFKPLACRTLAFWVRVFNDWLGMKDKDKKPPQTVNGLELQDLLKIYPKEHMYKVMKVFDANASDLLSAGKTMYTLKKIKVSILEIMATGVTMSPIICSRNKHVFLCGLFDEDDTGTLDKRQYLNLWKAWVVGLGKVFAVPVPHADDFHHLVRETFGRLAAKASRRLRAMAKECPVNRESIIKAIKDRKSGKDVGKSSERNEQVIPYRLLANDLEAREQKEQPTDPMFLLPSLAYLRFCSDRLSGSNTPFVEDFEKLSYSVPVPVPKELARIHSSDLPSRSEVILTREMIETIATEGFSGMEQIQRQLARSQMSEAASRNFKIRLLHTFAEINPWDLCRQGSLFRLLAKMYPQAAPVHLRLMYEWCEEYDRLADEENLVADAQQAHLEFTVNSNKRVIPREDLEAIKREFARLDADGIGAVGFADLARYLGTTSAEIAARYDVDADHHVGLNEFCKMMCPVQYRLPEMSGNGRRMIGKLVDHVLKDRKKRLSTRKSQFDGSSGSSEVEVSSFVAMLPPAPDDMWQRWREAFDEFDVDGDGVVQLSDFLTSGSISEPVGRFVIQLLDPEAGLQFSRDTFYHAMLKAFGYREQLTRHE